MRWFEIPIELSRSELPDVTIRVRWRGSRLGSVSGSSACIHRRERNQAVIGSHRECPPRRLVPEAAKQERSLSHPTCCDLAWSVWAIPLI